MIQTLNAGSFRMSGGKLLLKGALEKPGMLLIHADWCGHCQTFKPIYKQLDKRLNGDGVVFPLYAIKDTLITKELGTAMNIKGFPTIKFVDKFGRLIENYEGSRDLESLLSKICKVYHKCAR